MKTEAVPRILNHWLPLACVTTALCGLVYLAVQQVWRHSANDPQIQMAEDTAERLGHGGTVESVLPPDSVDVGRSLAPFVIVYNDAGVILGSSGLLHGHTPTVPAGVLAYAREHGEERVTWQPERGVRLATVVVRVTGTSARFVLVGRSLRETEARTRQFGMLTGIAWIVTLIGLLLIVAVSERIFVRQSG